jgi:DNA gyrase subunit A
MNVSNLRLMGRATQGVRLINIQDNDSIAAVTKVDHEEEGEGVLDVPGTVEPTNGVNDHVVSGDEPSARMNDNPMEDGGEETEGDSTPTDENN